MEKGVFYWIGHYFTILYIYSLNHQLLSFPTLPTLILSAPISFVLTLVLRESNLKRFLGIFFLIFTILTAFFLGCSNFVNCFFDRSVSQKHLTQLSSHICHSTYGYRTFLSPTHIWVKSWRNPRMLEQINISARLCEQLPKVRLVEVSDKRGKLNYEWVESYSLIYY